MKYDKTMSFECTGVILAIEFIQIQQKDCMAVSLSNRTIVFYELMKKKISMIGDFQVPSTQKCLAFIKRK